MTESKITLAEAKARPSLSPLVPCAECVFKVEIPAETDDDGTEHPSFWECHREQIRLYPCMAERWNVQGVLVQDVLFESHWPDTFKDGCCGQGVRK